MGTGRVVTTLYSLSQGTQQVKCLKMKAWLYYVPWLGHDIIIQNVAGCALSHYWRCYHVTVLPRIRPSFNTHYGSIDLKRVQCSHCAKRTIKSFCFRSRKLFFKSIYHQLLHFFTLKMFSDSQAMTLGLICRKKKKIKCLYLSHLFCFPPTEIHQ